MQDSVFKTCVNNLFQDIRDVTLEHLGKLNEHSKLKISDIYHVEMATQRLEHVCDSIDNERYDQASSGYSYKDEMSKEAISYIALMAFKVAKKISEKIYGGIYLQLSTTGFFIKYDHNTNNCCIAYHP